MCIGFLNLVLDKKTIGIEGKKYSSAKVINNKFNDDTDDYVRPPIPQKTMRLIDDFDNNDDGNNQYENFSCILCNNGNLCVVRHLSTHRIDDITYIQSSFS